MATVTRDAWKSAWKQIGEYDAGFTPPTYHHVKNQLLYKCYESTKTDVQRLIVATTGQSGCTIVSDGWSNVQRRPLINVMLVCPRGECFIKAVDSSRQVKSGSYIAGVIAEVIDEVGAANVVQVILDNAKNCKDVGRALEQ
ncbi:hypothetical protein L7F22_029496 [Adiantum nelumboides]|nr:hypothetical protein [Adiantum nelumboides]